MWGPARWVAAVAICSASGFPGPAFAQLLNGAGVETFQRTVPITLRISGDWGDYEVACDQPMIFAEQVAPTGELYVAASAGWGVFEAGYRYVGDVPPPAIRNYLEDNPEDGATTFVSGDMLLGPACDLSSVTAPEVIPHPIFAELEQANAACSDALIGLVLSGSNGPIPAVCHTRNDLLIELGTRVGAIDLDPEMLQRCTLEIGLSASTGQPPSDACVSFVETRSDQVERGFGLCDLAEPPKARLRIIDPRPVTFAARYTHDYQRFDCKRFRVEAFINTDPPDYFDLAAVSPQPDECLSVEYVRPTFQVRFSNDLLDQDWTDLVRLQTLRGVTEVSVPLDITRSGPRSLDIAPQSPLAPLTSYTLALRVEQDGFRSADFEELRVSDLVVPVRGVGGPLTDGAFRPVTWFTTMPYSDLLETQEPQISLHGAVYQVSRDAHLIRERPTATRIWWDWAPDTSGLEGKTPTFCADFDALNADNDTPLYDTKPVVIRPTADYDDDDKLYARDSANLFNWRPTPDVEALTLRMRPSRYYIDPDSSRPPPEVTAPHDIKVLGNSPLRMTFKYAYLQILDFEEGLSVDGQDAMAQHMQAARRYAWQVGPFGKVSVENLGATTPQGLGLTLPDDLVAGIEGIAGAGAQAFASQHCTRPDEVCFLFMPAVLRLHRDQSTPQTGRAIFASSAIMGFSSAFIDPPATDGSARAWLKRYQFVGNGADLAHEVGHSFGLYHMPLRVGGNDDYLRFSDKGGRFPSIDGVRMRLDGRGGTFKSSETGNPDDRLRLAPLMFPSVLPTGAGHPSLKNYNLWVQNAYLRAAAVYGLGYAVDSLTGKLNRPFPENDQSYVDAEKNLIRSDLTLLTDDSADIAEGPPRSVGIDTATAGQTTGISVHFASHPSSGQLDISTLQMPRATTAAAQTPRLRDGQTPVTLQAFAGDRALAEFSFGVRTDRSETTQVFLPVAQADLSALTHLRLVDENGQEMWHDAVTPIAPLQNATFATRDGRGTLTWTGDETALPVIVTFEGSDGTRRSIGSTTDTGNYTFDLADSGLMGEGRFVLTLDNGLTRSSTTVSANVASPFAVLITSVAGTALQPEAIVAMNRDLTPDLPDFTLFRDDQLVGVSMGASAIDDTLFIAPTSPLAPCASYQIKSTTPLRDTTGRATDDVLSLSITTGDPVADCPEDTAAELATLTMTRGDKVEESTGGVAYDAAAQIVRLTFPRMVLDISAGDWGVGTYGLAELGRGEARNTLALRYATDATEDGSLQIEALGGALHVNFSAGLRGGGISGSFTFSPEP